MSTGWANPGDRATILREATGATVIWDFDGVIADTETIHMDSFRTVLLRHGYTPELDFFDAVQGHTEADIWTILEAQGAPVTDPLAMIAERKAEYLAAALDRARPSWLALDLLPAIAAVAGRQVVLSNGVRETNVKLLEHWGLLHLVDVIDRGDRSKAERLAELVRGGRSLNLEDNGGYLQIARDGGAFCVGVLHALSPCGNLPAHLIVTL